MKKLTPKMSMILSLMGEGWEMGVSSTFDWSCRVQEGGLGKGGDCQRVASPTFLGLRDRGLIRQVKYSFPTSKWGLTEKAKELFAGTHAQQKKVTQ